MLCAGFFFNKAKPRPAGMRHVAQKLLRVNMPHMMMSGRLEIEGEEATILEVRDGLAENESTGRCLTSIVLKLYRLDLHCSLGAQVVVLGTPKLKPEPVRLKISHS